MKAKNEHEFTTVRIKKSTLYKLQELNARDRQEEHKVVKLHETVEKIVKHSLNK